MEKKKPRHLTDSGQLKPTRRLAEKKWKRAAGSDWKDTLKQRSIEIERFKELGIPLPNWATMTRAEPTIDPVVMTPSAVIGLAAAKECLAEKSAALPSVDAFKRAAPTTDTLSKFSEWRLCMRNIGLDKAMLFAAKHWSARACLKLKKGFYACSYAVCTQVYRFVRRIERMLGAVHDDSLGVLMQFVLVKIRRLFFHLSQFLFEVTFAIGHRRMLLLEREALALDVHQAFVHVADDLDD